MCAPPVGKLWKILKHFIFIILIVIVIVFVMLLIFCSPLVCVRTTRTHEVSKKHAVFVFVSTFSFSPPSLSPVSSMFFPLKFTTAWEMDANLNVDKRRQAHISIRHVKLEACKSQAQSCGKNCLWSNYDQADEMAACCIKVMYAWRMHVQTCVFHTEITCAMSTRLIHIFKLYSQLEHMRNIFSLCAMHHDRHHLKYSWIVVKEHDLWRIITCNM